MYKYASGDFSETAREARLPLKCNGQIYTLVLTFHWPKMCWNTSISKTSLFRISCLSQADWLDFLLIRSRSVTVHLPVEPQRPSTSLGLHRTAVFSATKVDGHWINSAIMSLPRTLSVSGGEWRVGWPGVDAGLLRDVWRVCERLSCHLIDSNFELYNVAGALFTSPQSRCRFCKQVERQLQPISYLLSEIARQF